jgi:hypothetical protein
MKKNSNGNTPNKTTAKDLDTMAIAGIKKYLASVQKITLAGTDYSAVTLTSALQAEIDAITMVDAGKAQLQQQVADTGKVRVKTRALRALLRKYILTTYGTEALQILGDFGMKAPKNLGPRTAAAKAQAQAKAKATREAKKKAVQNAPSEPATHVAAAVVAAPAKS